jgi:hypothetical protein
MRISFNIQGIATMPERRNMTRLPGLSDVPDLSGMVRPRGQLALPGLLVLLFALAAPVCLSAEVNSAAEVPTPLDTARPGVEPRRFDPLNPAMLNEAAMQKVRNGDIGTAAILLERAVLLAPYDKRIRQNLQTLRAWQSGKPPQTAEIGRAELMTAQTEEPDSKKLNEAAGMPVPLWKPVE